MAGPITEGPPKAGGPEPEDRPDVGGLKAFAVYLFAISALVFCTTVFRAVGLRSTCRLLLAPPMGLVGCSDTLWHTFWLGVAYYPLLLLPALIYGVRRNRWWLVLQGLLAAGHAAWMIAAW